MRSFLSRQFWPLIFVLVFSLPTLRNLLAPGFFPMHDDMQVMRVYEMSKCFVDMQFPCRWVPDMGYGFGYPQFSYYGPLPYYLMTLIHFLGVDLMASVKVGFLLSLVLGNIAFYALSFKIFQNRFAAFITAILYAYLPYRASDLFSRGAMGESWAFVFIPLVLLGLIQLLASPTLKSSLFLALSSALLIITHNVTTLIFFPFIGLITLIYIVTKVIQKKPILTHLKLLIFSGLLAFCLSAFFLLPVLFERGFVHIESMLGGYFDYRRHFLSFSQLFKTTNWAYGSSDIGPFDDLSFFFGPILIALASLAFIKSLLTLKRRPVFSTFIIVLFLCGLLSTLMTHNRTAFVYEKITALHYLQFPWRFLVTANFFFCLVAGSLFVHIHSHRYLITALVITPVILTQMAYFRPMYFTTETSLERLSGNQFDRMMTISIFDYLPKSSDFPPNRPATLTPSFSDPHYLLTDLAKGSDWYRFKTSSNLEQQVTVPIFNFPGWLVRINGQQISHTTSDQWGQITFVVPAGANSISLQLTDTPVRLLGNTLSLLGLLFFIYLSIRPNHVKN